MTFIVSFKKVFYQFFSIHSPCVSRTFFGVFMKRILTHTYSHPCKHLYTISFSHSFILLELNLFLYLRTLMTMLLQSKKKILYQFSYQCNKSNNQKRTEFSCLLRVSDLVICYVYPITWEVIVYFSETFFSQFKKSFSISVNNRPQRIIK